MFVRSLVAALSVLVAFTATPPADAETMLRVGMNLKGAPFSFHDDASGSDKGVSVDLVREIAKDVGFQVQFVPMTLVELIPAIIANKVEILAANLLVTPERSAVVDFSDAIAVGSDGLVVLKSDLKSYKTVEDLKGSKLGSQAGSPFAAKLQQSGSFPDLKIYPNGTEAMRAVASGEMQAAVVGINGAAYDIHVGLFPALRLVESYQPLVSSVDALVVRKGNTELLQKINASLNKLRANGTLRSILASYGQAGG